MLSVIAAIMVITVITVITMSVLKPAPYTADEQGHFKYTLTSEKEGRMDWEGQVSGTAISGKMVWKKDGQDDIHYTFQGQEVR